MVIKKIPYKASGTRKYNVMHNGKEYTCYLNPYNGNSVVTGIGNKYIMDIISSMSKNGLIATERDFEFIRSLNKTEKKQVAVS